MLIVSSCTTKQPRPVPEAEATIIPPDPSLLERPPEPAPFPVMLGIDVLHAQKFAVLAGKRVGLLSHAAAVNRAGEPTWSVLLRAWNVHLVALFAGEHGFDGKLPASAIIPDGTHAASGLPLYSLYGKTRRPTPAALKTIDVLVVDLQDIGSRSYTFVSAMCETMEACFVAGVEVVVLDRPNPLGGRKVDGPPVDPAWRSYVGALPVPYVHGLTIGELARFALATPDALKLTDEQRAAARLTIVPMRGWKRSMRWPDTGLAWQPTSHYISDFAAVEGYAMLGLGCQLGAWKHGVGKNHPFRGLYYPRKRADDLARELNALNLPGIAFNKIDVVNEHGKKVNGVLVEITDWDALRPTEISFHLMRLACAWSGSNPFRAATKSQMQSFNRHTGSDEFWNAIVREGAKVDIASFVERWTAEAAAFRELSRQFWLYPDAE
jgi:uncharacterized protein YbbC (DUF1343 family)